MRFGHRSSRASSRESLDRSTTSSAAAAAATAAFYHDAEANAFLSSAAAAAALRSHTTTPEPVGSIQTKRMIRRGSGSSVGSESAVGNGNKGGGPGRGGLQRRDSGGSMSERTFRTRSRSTSPARSDRAVSPASDAPPVPAIPKNLAKTMQHQRASSMDPQPRVTSPTPGRGGKGVSMDRGGVQPRPTTPKLSKRSSDVAKSVEQDRQNNVNFSRPMSNYIPPPDKKYTHGTGSWFSGAAGATPSADGRPQSSDGTSRKSGVYASSSNHNQSQQYASGQPAESRMVYDPNTRTFVPQQRERSRGPDPVIANAEDEPSRHDSYDPNSRKVISRPGTPKSASTGSSAPDATTKPKKAKPTLQVVQSLLEPPPKNPARYTPSGSVSPTSPRATGFLHKQPSVVREDLEGEAKAAKDSPPSAVRRTMRTPAGPAKTYVASPASVHGRSSSLDIPRPYDDAGQRGRNVSISPNRSAHFSASPVIDAHIHVPPPRTSSPVKSAMKHSPASSIRTASPLLFSSTGPKGPESEAGSEVSEDSAFLGKRKKGARVSFNEQPQEIDEATAAATPNAIASSSLTPMSPTRSRSPAVADDTEEIIKPRPALPSFSSVRRSRMPEVAEKVTETPPDRGASADHAVGGILAQDNMQKNAVKSLSLPTQVTSKASSGSVSDESEEEPVFPLETTGTPVPVGHRRISVDEKDLKDLHLPKVKDFATSSSLKAEKANGIHPNEALDVPTITLLPPTPGIDEDGRRLGEDNGDDRSPEGQQSANPKPKKSMMFSIPGSWMDSDDADAPEPISAPAAPSQPAEAAEDTAPPLLAHVPQASEPLATTTLRSIDEDSDDSAAFSDAAEDLSDRDDVGFASLDAIASSPVAPVSVKKSTAPTESEGASAPEAQLEGKDGNWTHATAYWSQLSRQQKQQIERNHLSSDDETGPKAAPAPKLRKKKQVVGTTLASAPSRQPAQPMEPAIKQQPTQMAPQQRQLAQPAQPALKKSTRAPDVQTAQPTLKKSLRSPESGAGSAAADGEVHMRRSMRGAPAPQRPQSDLVQSRAALPSRDAALRPMSAGAATMAAQPQRLRNEYQTPPPPQKQSVQPPPGPATASSRPQAALRPSTRAFAEISQKKVNNDSDSESSFKKKRRPSANAADSTGRYAMRRSMRVGSVDRHAERPMSPPSGGKSKSGTFSLRSNSPSGSTFSGMKRETLRSSLRPSNVGANSVRSGPAANGRASNMFGASVRPSTASVAPPRKSAFKSRIAQDSDDEEDDRPSRSFFKSRYADSDDEDETGGAIKADLAPVRGIPRRRGQEDGDSTDLEDEEDDNGTRKASQRRGKQIKPIVPDSADVDRAMEAARRKLGIGLPSVAETAEGGKEKREGNALTQGSLRNPAGEEPEPKSRFQDIQGGGGSPLGVEKKRSGFMGGLLRRNRNSSTSVQQALHQPESSAALPPVLPYTASPQTGQVEAPSTPTKPQRAKLVRRSSAQPKLTRGDSSMSTSAALPPTPEGILRRKDSENWPLSPSPKNMTNGILHEDAEMDRPTTSDGVAQRIRMHGPDDAELVVLGGAPEAIYSQRTGRKKKFSKLRRAFGMDD